MILIYNCQCLIRMRRIYFFGRDDFANVVELPSKGIFTERKIRYDANGTADG